jgi:hypothetical protein
MTGHRPTASEPERTEPVSNGWQGSIPELVISCALIAGICVAAYGYAGAGASALVLVIWAVVILLVLRVVMPATPPPLNAVQENWQRVGRSSFLGFWRKRGMLNDAASSMVSYDTELRATLQHLLAARLADRHGISLYADPDAARRLLLRGQREQDLWFWLDPRRPAEMRQGRRGIPPQTLAAIIDRLERL